jgi:hypothetical protein
VGDRGQTKDLSRDRPQDVRRLLGKLEEWKRTLPAEPPAAGRG